MKALRRKLSQQEPSRLMKLLVADGSAVHLSFVEHASSRRLLDAQCRLTEPKILQLLSSHLHVTAVHDVAEDKNHLQMVLDLCTGPDLYLNCMKLLTNHFRAVEETESWKFLQNNDPRLELEILRFIKRIPIEEVFEQFEMLKGKSNIE